MRALRNVVLAGALALLLSAPACAAGPRPAPAPGHLDYVFLASDRPVLIRLHLEAGGKPYYAPWDVYMRKFFAWFDRNGDGVLDRKEAANVPNFNFLNNTLAGAIGLPSQGQMAPFAELDRNKDGKVTFAEFADYYRRTGFGPVRFSTSSNESSTKAVTDALYKHLDSNKDGRLSRAELARAEKALAALDEDEDEMWTAAELSPPSPAATGPYSLSLNVATRAEPATGPGFLEVRRDRASLEGLVRQVLARYDRDKDRKLSRAELKLEKALFDSLDADGDGKLDAAELAGFFRREADVELVGRVGSLPGVGGLLGRLGIPLGGAGVAPERAGVYNPRKRAMPLAGRVKRVDPDTLGLSLGDARLLVQAGEGRGTNVRNVRQFYEQQFRILDVKNRGFVERKQEKENAGNPYLFQIFPLADRDGDGKLTRKELSAYFDLQEEGSNCYAVVSVTDQGRGLFDLIDADGDGRLSVRELRTAWERVGPLARDRRGLAPGDIPRRLQVSLGQGQAFFRTPARPVGPGRASGAVPLWFRKMDRNNDGDVSRNEFLGTDEEFKAIDADGDGLISAEEARRFEARRKKGK
jgi:Ca2+-binding EF-hand superfamily protein